MSASLLLAACRSTSSDGPTDPTLPPSGSYVLAGSYALAAVDGKPLPVAIDNNISIVGGKLTVAAAGTWSESRSVAGASTVTVYGTWIAVGGAYRFLVGPTPYYLAQPTAGGIVLSQGSTMLTFARDQQGAAAQDLSRALRLEE